MASGLNSLGDFKYPEQSQGSQHTDAKRRPRFNHVPDHLTDASHDHLERRTEDETGRSNRVKYRPQPAATYTKVKAVKRGVEIIPHAEAVHLQRHLGQKQTQEDELRRVWFQRQTGMEKPGEGERRPCGSAAARLHG